MGPENRRKKSDERSEKIDQKLRRDNGARNRQKIGEKVGEEIQAKSEGHILVPVPFSNCVFAPP